MESFLGSGDLYMDRLTAAGVRQGLFFAGNCKLFSLQSNAEIKDQSSKGRNDYGQVLTSATRGLPPALKVVLDQLDQKNLAMAFLGDVEDIDITGDTETDEALTVLTLDHYQRLGARSITDGSVTVSRDAGADAIAWADEAAYTSGAYCIPSVANLHFYKCTVSGTSGALEPTWPTNGGTVTDGTVTWQDMGLILAVEDTDFEVITRNGLFRALSTGSIEAGEALTIGYTYTSYTGYKVKGAVQPTIKAYLFLDGKNETNGKDVEVEVWAAQLRPTSPVDFLADDFTALELEGTPATPTGYDSPFEIKQFD